MTKKYLGFCAALLMAVGVSAPVKAEPGDAYVRGGYGIFNFDGIEEVDWDRGSQFWFAVGFYPDWADLPIRVEGEIASAKADGENPAGSNLPDDELKYTSVGGNILAENEFASGVYGAIGIGAGFMSWEGTAEGYDPVTSARATVRGDETDLYYQLMLEGRVDFTESVGGLLQVNYLTVNADELEVFELDDFWNFRVGLQLDF